jgi:predicted RNA-binding protein with PUA domain
LSRGGDPATVSMKTITEIKLTDPADLPPEQREAFEARMAKIRESIERHWDDQMKSLVRGGHVPPRPAGVEFKLGDLS